MQYEQKFGVLVDKNIPQEDKNYLYQQWEQWKEGIEEYKIIFKQSLMTSYEHFVLGSGVGLPPDPFKPLCLQHKDANLEEVITQRRYYYSPDQKKEGSMYSLLVPNIQSLLHVNPIKCHLIAKIPDINEQGRIPIPEIVDGSYQLETAGNKQIIAIPKEIISQLRLSTTNTRKLKSGATLQEVFDFEKGYRIELLQ